MKNRLFIALSAATMLGIVGCSQPKKGNVQNETSPSEQTTQSVSKENKLLGVYKGTFPCADSEGKKVSLTIAEDGTYHLEYEYLNEKDNDGVIEENGTYRILNDTIVETTTPSSGNKSYYVRLHEDLMLSDSLGTINKGELAEMYILKRQ